MEGRWVEGDMGAEMQWRRGKEMRQRGMGSSNEACVKGEEEDG